MTGENHLNTCHLLLRHLPEGLWICCKPRAADDYGIAKATKQSVAVVDALMIIGGLMVIGNVPQNFHKNL